MATDMTLIWFSGSPPCWRVMIALEEKNLQGYNQKLLDFLKGEHKSQEVLDINPRGQLPAFKHGNNILNESYAACLYLEEQFKSQGTRLIPMAAPEQALTYQRITFCLLSKNMHIHFPEGERHDSSLKRHREALTAELKLWEGYLEKLGAGSYLAGKNFTLADVVVFPCIAYVFRFGLSEKNYPRLAGYYGLLKERPSVKTSWPKNWLETPQAEDKLKDI
uniref:Glutathione S-transferase rho n=1 Tax=Gadus morhua TaxID=8049 RepID=A0A8C5FGA3_GADMO